MDRTILPFKSDVLKGNNLVEEFGRVADKLIKDFPFALLRERDLQIRRQQFEEIADNSVKTTTFNGEQKKAFRDATLVVLHHMSDTLDALEGALNFDDEKAVRDILSGQKQVIVNQYIETAISEKMLPDTFRRRSL